MKTIIALCLLATVLCSTSVASAQKKVQKPLTCQTVYVLGGSYTTCR